jgi:hypothetical protein
MHDLLTKEHLAAGAARHNLAPRAIDTIVGKLRATNAPEHIPHYKPNIVAYSLNGITFDMVHTFNRI